MSSVLAFVSEPVLTALRLMYNTWLFWLARWSLPLSLAGEESPGFAEQGGR